jgi:hypothetical protein
MEKVTDYTIIKRCDTEDRRYDIDFPDRDYDLPLCGCDNYEDDLEVGDMVSIILETVDIYPFDYSPVCHHYHDIKFETKDNGVVWPKKTGSAQRVEEHFFKIIGYNEEEDNFIVERKYIDNDKIIVKSVKKRIDTRNGELTDDDIAIFPIDLIPTRLLLSRYYCDGFKQFPVNEEYEIYSCWKVDRLIEYLNSTEKELITKKKLKSLMPYRNYKLTLFDLPEKQVSIENFLSCIAQHSEILIKHFGKEEYEKFGNFQLIEENMEILINNMYNALGRDTFIDEIEYEYNCPPHLSLPKLNNDNHITTLLYDEVFRVFKKDPQYCLFQTNTVSNWGGIYIFLLLDSIIL